METDRNRQYGTIAIKNDFLKQEQFDECFNFMERLQKKNPSKEIQVEHILLEKGYISDAQHQVVLQVMKRLTMRRGPTSVMKKPITCRHCGTPNAADAKTCESCQGPLQLESLELVEEEDVRTCPNCAGDIKASALQCACGLMFCPQCRGIRNPTEVMCGACGFCFPDSGRVEVLGGPPSSGSHPAASPASGGLSQTQIAGIAGGGVLLLLVILFFAFSGGGNAAEVEELFTALDGQRAIARKSLRGDKYEKAREQYGLALETIDKIKRRTEDSEQLETAKEAARQIEKKLSEIDKKQPDKKQPDKTKKQPDKTKKQPDKKQPTKVAKHPDKKQPDKKQPDETPGGTPRLPVPPARLSDKQVARALDEFRGLGLVLPTAPRVAKSKLILLFLKNGEEVVGQLEKETDQLLTVQDFSGRRRSIVKSSVTHRVMGRFYDGGPRVALVSKTGRPIPGELVKIDGKYAEVKRDGATEPVLREKIRPVVYYLAYRHLNTPKSSAEHIELGRLCLQLGLARQARREFAEAGRQSPEAMLRVLPNAHPELYFTWRLKRKAGSLELIELARWAEKHLGPREAVKAYEAAVLANQKLEFDGEVQLAIAQAWIDAKEYDRARKVIERVRGSLPGPLQQNAKRMLEKLGNQQSSAKKMAAEELVNKVMKEFFEQLELVASRIARDYDDYTKVLSDVSSNKIWQEVVKLTAKKTRLTVAQVEEGLRERGRFPAAYKPLKIQYGQMTWMIKTPDTLVYEYGTDKIANEKNAYWGKLSNRRMKTALVVGLFAEEKLEVKASRRKCPRCKGKRALSGFENIQLQLKRMDKHCRGTGHYRSIEAR